MTKLRAIDAEPVGQEVIAVLERALEQAKAGEISSVGLAVVYRSGVTAQAWSAPPSIGVLMGSAARLVYRLNQALD